MRCTTLVKLPVALSGGSRLNCAPEAANRLSTAPSMGWSGKASSTRRAFCPGRMRPTWVSLKLAWTQMPSSGTSDSSPWPFCTYWPTRALRWPTRPLTGARISVRARLISAWATSVRALAICASRRWMSAPRVSRWTCWARRSASALATWERATRESAVRVVTRSSET
ncbi:hypothetical protein D3C76_962260 [compost metagenome]